MNKALTWKTLVVGALALALMVPVAMIRNLVAERQARRDEAVAGIAQGWGKRQSLSVYVAVPYERHWLETKKEVVDGRTVETRKERSEALVLRIPASRVQWTVNARLHEKARGIYKARLYDAKIGIAGIAMLPARVSESGASVYKWHVPRLVLGVSDPLGVRATPQAIVNGRSAAFDAGTSDSAIASGLHAPLPEVELSKPQQLEFAVELELGGSEAIAVAPLGTETALAMRADWPHPSFQGRFLPASHEIDAAGFAAQWKVSRLAAAASCAWPCPGEEIGVSFIEPAGLYQQLERTSKYGFLFIGLTFAAFMLFELLRRIAVHPLQYALVGLALAMFFLLLTALSEHIAFAAAYAIAALACVGVITAYVVAVLRSLRLGLAFGAALAALYAMLYSLLKAEDYALLGGSLLLFGLLAAVMLATRRVDWYAITAPGGQRV